jgi:CDP-diacylglycerol--serine O-phosphatidyltransferase
MRVPPEMVLPVFVSVVFFVALLIGYPWHILSFGSVLYLLSLPWGWKSYRDHERNAAVTQPAPAAPSTPTFEPAPGAPAPGSPAPSDTEDERPTRLN